MEKSPVQTTAYRSFNTASAAHRERLSSAVRIVFEQSLLICHLVEGAFVAWRREALSRDHQGVHLGSQQWSEAH